MMLERSGEKVSRRVKPTMLWILIWALTSSCGSPIIAPKHESETNLDEANLVQSGDEDAGYGEQSGSEALSESGTNEEEYTPAFTSCPATGPGELSGHVSPPIVEASGIVESRKNSGIYFVHNDNGNDGRMFAITNDGSLVATFQLGGVGLIADDVEDIAIGPGPIEGESYVYLADTGGNGFIGAMDDTFHIFRFVEPTIDSSTPTNVVIDAADIEAIPFSYSGSDSHPDVETLLVDRDGSIGLIKKESTAAPLFYRLPSSISSETTNFAELQGAINLGLAAPVEFYATAGDVSYHGDVILVRATNRAFLWLRDSPMSLFQALSQEPCPVDIFVHGLGEGVALRSESDVPTGYISVTEGESGRIHLYSFDK